jgi:hypothetical protein
MPSHLGRSRRFGSLGIRNSGPSASSSAHYIYAPAIFLHHSLCSTPVHSVLSPCSLTSSQLLARMHREDTVQPHYLSTPEAVVRISKQLLSLENTGSFLTLYAHPSCFHAVDSLYVGQPIHEISPPTCKLFQIVCVINQFKVPTLLPRCEGRLS